MPQYDDPPVKTVLFSFNMRETFASLPSAECLTLVLITNGKVVLTINGKTIALIAPCLYLCTWHDKVILFKNAPFTAKSFSFHPTFVNKSFTIVNLDKNNFCEIADELDYTLLGPFLSLSDCNNGIIKPLPQTYLRISEWFDLAGKENDLKSDKHWLYRVRRYLMQILFLLVEACHDDANTLSDEAVTDIVLDYIHDNFSNEISLDALCKLVYVNRTTLNRKFKARTRRSPIDYLLHHRLNVACGLLTHSSLTVKKIAEVTGFKYENYFARQFMDKIGMTPTQYRQSDGFETLNLDESRIIDEF